MGNLHKPLELVQIGNQSAVGTSVAATWQLRMPMEFSDAGVVETPPAANGLMMMNSGHKRQAVEKAVNWTIPAHPVNAEDLLVMLYGGMGVTPSPDGSTVEALLLFLHKFTRTLTGVPSINGLTIEHRTSDGSTQIDNEYADAFMTEFQLSGARGQMVQFSASGMANKRATAAITDLSANFPVADVGYFPSDSVSFFVDDTYGTIGTTEFADDVLGWTFKFESGFFPLRPANGGSGLGYPLIGMNGGVTKASLEMTCLAKTGASELYVQERGKAESGLLRGIQCELNGVAADTGSTARKILLDMTCKHVPETYIASGEEDGQQIVTLQLESAPEIDGSETDWLGVSVQSSSADISTP